MKLYNQSPQILNQPGNIETEPGQIVTLEIQASGAWPLHYQWKKDGVPLHGENTNKITFRIREEEDGGSFTCEVKNQYGQIESRAINIAVLEFEEEQEDDPEAKGNIIDEKGRPVKNATVEVFDKTFGKEKSLGSTSTDENGNFQLSYNSSDLDDGCGEEKETRETANLMVKVYDEEENLLVRSGVFIDSDHSQDINIHTSTTEDYIDEPRFEKAKRRLSKHFEQVEDLSDLKEDDIETLIECTKVPPDDVSGYFNAESANRATGGEDEGLDKELMFGIFRKTKGTFTDVLNMDSNDIKDTIEEAIDENIIRGPDDLDPGDFADEIKSKGSGVIEENMEGTSTDDFMNNAGFDNEEKKKAINSILDNQNEPSDNIWQDMKERGVGADKVDDLKLSNDINNATGRHPDMTNHIRENLEISDPIDMAQYDAEDWENELNNGEIDPPPYIQGEDDDERRRNYAEDITGRVEDTFPTASFVSKYINDDDNEYRENLQTFTNNNPGFSLPKDNINVYIAENEEAFEGIDEPEAFEEKLKEIQRVYKLCPKNDKYRCFKILQDGNIKSARDVIQMGRTDFINKFGEDLGINPVVNKVWNNAELIHQTALKVSTEFSGEQNTTTTNAIKPNRVEEVDLQEIPNFSDLFGPTSFCTCNHCRSSLSPAAYLADLLNFLKDIEVDGSNETLKERLFIRRPEIGKLLLSCKNTNTSMPYIDMVNEILENAIAPDENFAPQTTKTTAELNAMPENINEKAYDDYLSKSFYPWTLPFDLWIEEIRTYLGHIGLTYFDINKKVPVFGGDTMNEHNLNAEYLGLTELERAIITEDNEQFEIITETDFPSLEDFYDVSSTSELSNLSLLLGKTGLQYNELLEILHTDLIDAGPENISNLDESCNIDVAEINISDADLNKLHRFTRLLKKIRFNPFQLDRVMKHLDIAEINNDAINLIAKFDQLVENLDGDPVTLLAFWEKIDTKTPHNDKSLYESLFLNKNIQNPLGELEDVFKLNDNGDELENANDFDLTDNKYAQHIASVLQISGNELDKLFDKVLSDTNNNLDNLSVLFRNATLARLSGISVEEHLTIKNLSEVEPFSNLTSALEFVEDVHLIKDSPFSPEGLKFLLTNEGKGEGNAVALSLDGVKEELIELLDYLQEIWNEGKALEDNEDDREVTEKILGRHFQDGIFEQAMNIISGDSELSEDDQSDFIDDYFTEILNYNGEPNQDFKEKLIVDDGSLESEEERFSYVRSLVQPYYLGELIKIRLRERTIVFWSESLDINQELVQKLLKGLLRNTKDADKDALEVFIDDDFLNINQEDINREDFPHQFDVADHLSKVISFIQAYDWNENEVYFMFNNDLLPDEWLSLNELPTQEGGENKTLSPFLKLQKGMNAESEISDSNFSLMELIKIAREEQSIVSIREYISENSNWYHSDLAFTIGIAGFNFSYQDFYNEEPLLKLNAAYDILRKVETTASSLIQWNRVNPDRSVSKQIISAIKSKYSNERWLEIAPQLRDPLREKQRDALQALVIQWNKSFMNDEHDLYNYFLIDTKMSSCMITSRVLNATLSIQLFVQRIMLSLESEDMKIPYKKAKEWEWRKQYRVWEANRKIFLFPENWLEPELRDNKTDLFTQYIEDEILHKDINDKNVTEAFKGYLKELDKIADPEVLGMCKDENDETWYVFARTKSTPAVYYFREWKDDSYWTHWKKIDAPISSTHLIPVMHNGRLFIFWPDIIQKTADEDIENAGSENARPPDYEYLISLNWTEYRDGQWLEPSHGEERMTVKDYFRKGLDGFKKSLYFRAGHNDEGDLMIYVFSFHFGGPVRYDNFKMEGCSFRPVVVVDGNTTDVKSPSELGNRKYSSYMKIASTRSPFYFYVRERDEFVREDFSDVSGQDDIIEPEKHSKGRILSPNTRYQLLFPHQNPDFKEPEPFFLDGPTYTFFSRVETEEILIDEDVTIHNESVNMIGTVVTCMTPMSDNVASVSASAVASNSNSVTVDVTNESNPDNSYDILRSTPRIGINDFVIKSHNQNSFSIYEHVITSETETREIPGVAKRYHFYSFFHNYLCNFVTELNRHGIEGILDPDPDSDLYRQQLGFDMFEQRFNPNEKFVKKPYPAVDIDFRTGGGYSIYNWELFYHAPMIIAEHLSANRRFEEAQKWFHFIFDPVNTEGDFPDRVWKIKPFYEEAIQDPNTKLKEIITHEDEDEEEDEVSRQIDTWRSNPFNPFAVARLRTSAYMKRTVMSYLDNLIAWGDHLFTQDTMESVNEATQIYLLANQILGDKPIEISRESSEPQSFNDMESDMGNFSNALVEVENAVFKPGVSKQGEKDREKGQQELVSLMYFCSPQNENLHQYWDTIEDRLYKIRHCLDIEGAQRDLSLFAPPIDPGAIVAAMAGGGSLAGALGTLNAPLPYYKFRYILQLAKELCNEVKSLGNNLLQAIEKRDSEKLALLREQHNVSINNLMKDSKEEAIKEAEQNIVALKEGKKVTEHRKDFYKQRISKGNLHKEQKQIDKNETIQTLDVIAGSLRTAESAVSSVPSFEVGAAGISSPFTTAEFGGRHVNAIIRGLAEATNIWASIERSKIQVASLEGTFERRDEDWEFQKENADKDLAKIDEDIKAAEIRKEMAVKELNTQVKQIDNAEEVADLLENKFSNEDLYKWMKSTISKLYFQSYELAHSLAKQAERAYKFELADDQANFIGNTHWNGLKKGLLAGEKLFKDLQRMEVSYLENNKRDYELTKHISLAMLNPAELLNLKEKGECFFEVPELLFDLDHPGQYMRRIKSVRLTIPCVTGNYTNVTAKLTMVNNKMRVSTNDSQNYGHQGTGDSRFKSNLTTKQSIATSEAQNDSGMFEMNFEDDRYLPFEGAGAITTWFLQLPEVIRQFDYDTISDVILTIDYTAKDGGGLFREVVNNYLKDNIQQLLKGDETLPRLFSLKTEFPGELHKFLNPEGSQDHEATMNISRKHFPHFLNTYDLKFENIYLILKVSDKVEASELENEEFVKLEIGSDSYDQEQFKKDSNFGKLLTALFEGNIQGNVKQPWKIKAEQNAIPGILQDDNNNLDPQKIDDILLYLEYKAEED